MTNEKWINEHMFECGKCLFHILYCWLPPNKLYATFKMYHTFGTFSGTSIVYSSWNSIKCTNLQWFVSLISWNMSNYVWSCFDMISVTFESLVLMFGNSKLHFNNAVAWQTSNNQIMSLFRRIWKHNNVVECHHQTEFRTSILSLWTNSVI